MDLMYLIEEMSNSVFSKTFYYCYLKSNLSSTLMLFLFDFVTFDTIMHVTCSCTVFQSFQTLLVRCIFSFWEKARYRGQ